MERALILRNMMNEKGLKVADIVRLTDIPYSTIKSMLENGIEKTGYANVCKFCEALGITTDQLEEMAASHIPEKKELAYSDTKRLLARNGKNLTAEQRIELIRMLSELDTVVGSKERDPNKLE